MSDEELKQLFWSLTKQVVDPMLELARTHTTPSIERSVLARMGVPSHDAKAVVDGCLVRGLLGHGAGHVVLRAARAGACGIPEAAQSLAQGRLWDEVEEAFNW